MKTIRLVFAVLFTAVGIFAGPAFAGDRVIYYHNDALGSPVVMTDSARNVVWQADYEPFGEISALVDNLQAPNTHQFIGKEFDLETSLHYLGARFYDGNIGRFLSVDPALRLNTPRVALITPQLLNNYGYSANNPYRFIDRDGRFIQLVPLALAVGGAFLTSAFLPSTVNAPSDKQDLLNAQTSTEFGVETGIGAASGFITGKVIQFLRGAAAKSAAELLYPGGKAIGEAGSRSAIRNLPGGQKEAESIFEKLSKGGKAIEDPSYPGKQVELPGGGRVGLRPESGSGGPAIDINVPGVPIEKIHFKE